MGPVVVGHSRATSVPPRRSAYRGAADITPGHLDSPDRWCSRVETRTRNVPGFFMRARQQHEVRPRRSRNPHPQFVAKKEHLHEARFLPNEANRRKALSTKELSVRAASHSACGADGYSPHGNSRKSQLDYKQRFMTITSQPASTPRKPCNFADPNGSRRDCNLRPASLLFSVIAVIALFAPLFFFGKSAFYGRFLPPPCIPLLLQGMQRGAEPFRRCI
jgi:hypothetical protein